MTYRPVGNHKMIPTGRYTGQARRVRCGQARPAAERRPARCRGEKPRPGAARL